MADARITRLSRWRAVLRLAAAAGRWKVSAFGALILVSGLLPTAAILMTGRLVAAIPAAVRPGAGAAEARPALLALGWLVGCLAALALAGIALAQLSRFLDAAFAAEVHHRVARVTLGTPGLAALEDPAVMDELGAIQDAERRGVLRQTMAALSNVATMRLRGAGAFVVLFGFNWWAPLLLAAAWQLTNRVYLQATENGVSVNMSDGAVRLRRAEYLRSLALEAPAAKEVRVFGLDGWLVGRYGDAWLEALGVLWRSRKANRGITAAATLGLALSHGAVLAALGTAAARGDVSGAAMIVFVQAVIATSDLGMIGDWQWILAQSMAVAERVTGLAARIPAATTTTLGASSGKATSPPLLASSETTGTALNASSSPEAGAALNPHPPTASGTRSGPVGVRLDGVRFTYRGRELPTLDGLTLDIPPGQSIAIVGENGAGKSTLVKLLCGLYEPQHGRVTLDGGASPVQSRGRIGVIFQDFVRYPLPLRENVAFGHLPLMNDGAALERALADAGGAALLAGMPHGWDTVLSREYEGGVDLSGGQWQRVALARALAAVRGGAGLLILDEPTAALDVRAEAELFERFLQVTRGVTTILVSHRLSSVRRADRIVVIEGGRVVEDGSHAELMRAGGRYAEMYSLQAERFAVAVPLAQAGVEEVVDA
ncbi:ATP-binding cassette domain-containing protein [Longimicrobium terrae]|uniref:ATP-binding cassette subfamily B protein n=1 Tax=Longimicrobium terrae TaxID=1639882 RepID=A0A841GL06_9BACT|nr:ATP-binding cassette domain-containing protein [Longimicrobium terrae]MBB4635037.1 ATP-binding cassette subfamily B protein [Longimicrobium terrae]MBB6069431.1 ATP-binding cassette subfamily B protein [Longimicrobium terrae]NNC31764.1 ATP-binding cassette domain-containing protein [Longimicrobium terrae]